MRRPRSLSAPRARAASPAASPPRVRSAFTMIEILIVIGVLLVLVTIVIFAARGGQSSAAQRATRATFENLKGMLTELEVGGGGRRQPVQGWYFDDTSTNLPAVQVTSGFDIWADGDLESVGTNEPLGHPELPVGIVTENNSDRFADEKTAAAILNTQIVMTILTAVPANRNALQQLPADVLANLEDQTLTPLPSDPPPPPTSPQRYDESINPIILDAWRNPIIFVPSAGLNRVFEHDAATPYMPGTYVVNPGGEYFRSLQPIGGQPTSDAEYWQPLGTTAPPLIRSPDRRPFFASAGPDGSFAASDDNLYSFEN